MVCEHRPHHQPQGGHSGAGGQQGGGARVRGGGVRHPICHDYLFFMNYIYCLFKKILMLVSTTGNSNISLIPDIILVLIFP